MFEAFAFLSKTLDYLLEDGYAWREELRLSGGVAFVPKAELAIAIKFFLDQGSNPNPYPCPYPPTSSTTPRLKP